MSLMSASEDTSAGESAAPRGRRFAPGTFAPAPQASPALRMLAAQTRIELTLLLRNGEQLLLTMFIPITLLIGLCLLPFDGLGDDRVAKVVPKATP